MINVISNEKESLVGKKSIEKGVHNIVTIIIKHVQ